MSITPKKAGNEVNVPVYPFLYLLLYDGAVSADPSASKEAVMHHALK